MLNIEKQKNYEKDQLEIKIFELEKQRTDEKCKLKERISKLEKQNKNNIELIKKIFLLTGILNYENNSLLKE